MSEPPPSGHDELARALTALRPLPADLDRDRLMFQAGQLAQAARCRRWQWSTGLACTAAACLSLVVLQQSTVQPVVRVVQVPTPAPTRPIVPPDVPIPGAVLSEPPPPGSPAWRLEHALQQAQHDAPAAAEPEEDTPPVRGPALSTWQWRRDVSWHPSILEEGD
jgi:hypothetical protein